MNPRKEQMILLLVSVFVSLYFGFLYMNAYYWHVNNVFLRGVQELITIPFTLAPLAVLILLVRGIVAKKYSFNVSLVSTAIISVLTIVLVWGNLILAKLQ